MNYRSALFLLLFLGALGSIAYSISKPGSKIPPEDFELLDVLNRHHGEERVVAFNALSPDEQSRVWVAKYERMQKLDWNKAQLQFIRKMQAMATPEFFAGPMSSASRDKVLNEAAPIFDFYQIMRLFFTSDTDLGGPSGPNGPNDPGGNNGGNNGGGGTACSCTAGLYCVGDGLSMCRPEQNCTRPVSGITGCGFMYNEPCTGTCHTILQWSNMGLD